MWECGCPWRPQGLDPMELVFNFHISYLADTQCLLTKQKAMQKILMKLETDSQEA